MNIAHTLAVGTVAGFALGLVTTIAIGGTGWVALATQDTETTAVACEQEDSPGPCYWNAQERGNHLGTSFVRDANGTVTYLPPVTYLP